MSDNADEYAPVNIQAVVINTQPDVTIEEYADVYDVAQFVNELVEDMVIDTIAADDVTDAVIEKSKSFNYFDNFDKIK